MSHGNSRLSCAAAMRFTRPVEVAHWPPVPSVPVESPEPEPPVELVPSVDVASLDPVVTAS
jgi:hypothetical protein